jgi:beta-lactamase class A
LPGSEIIEVRDVDLSPPPSAVADAWPGRRTWSVAELEALARAGDNTALDLLIKRVGGPGGVEGWLDVKRIENVNVDRYRRQIAADARGLPSFRSEWKGRKAWREAVAAIPPDQRVQAGRERADDPRDTATPIGLLRLLEAFTNRELVSKPDPARLLGRDAGYLAEALPDGARIIQSAGAPPSDLGVQPTSHAVAFVELKTGERIAFVVFLTASTAPLEARERIVADVGRAVLKEF